MIHSRCFSEPAGLNREHIVYRGYSGCTIDKLSLKGIREVDKFKQDLLYLQTRSNDLCSIDIQVNYLVHKIVEFTEMLRGRGGRKVCVYKFYTGSFSLNQVDFQYSEWFNARVDSKILVPCWLLVD